MSAERVRRRVVRAAVPAYLTLICGVPTAVTVPLVRVTHGVAAQTVALVVSPLVFVTLYVLTAACLSALTRRAMVPGRFPRDLGDRVYGSRRLYALCWTSIYYAPVIYHAVLAVPLLRWLTFRMFGYRGDLDVTLYPDAWIRDLPVLELGSGAYISNRATLGTNMCLMDGTVLVAPVRVGRGAMVGHLAMLAPGATLEEGVEVGVGTAIGLNVYIGTRSRVGPRTTVNHGAKIGSRCEIGTQCLIGIKAVIHDRIRIVSGSVVPDRALVRTQQEANEFAPAGTRERRMRIEAMDARTAEAS